VVIVAPGPEDKEEEKLGGRIVWVKGPPLPPDPRYYVLWNEKKVHAILDREEANVVEGSSPWSGGWFVNRWKGSAAKALIFHQDPVAVFAETLFDRLAGRSTINTAMTPFWAYLRRLSARYDTTVTSGQWLADKLDGQRIQNPHAVSFGIDKQRFNPSHASEETRLRLCQECRVGPDAKLMLTVSRMHPEKRFGTIFRAFERASKEEEMGLVVFGDGPMRSLVHRRGNKIPGVHFAGYTSDPTELPRVYASCDAMLHGSAAETYGLVIAEAICSGLPVVVPDIGGAADLAHPSYSEVYPPGDSKAASEALLRLLRRDRAGIKEACAAATIARVGTMDDHFRELFGYYEGLAG
jgi:alpha-1,6-mannosyltransferase